MRPYSRLLVVLISLLVASCGGLDTSGRVELGEEQLGTLDGRHTAGDYWFDAEYDGNYVVLAQSSGFADLTLSIYSDYQRTRLVQDCDVLSYEMCVVTLTRGRYFVRVHSLTASVFSGTFGITLPYQFTIVAGENEGTADAPIELDPDAPTHTVAPSGASYYLYDVPSAGGLDFAVRPTAAGLTPQVNARLYAGADFTSVPITGTCTSTGCRFFGVPSGPIGIRVDEEGALPAVFELAITSTLSEGAPTEPVPLTLGANYQDASVDSDSGAYSYYSVTTGSAAGSLVFAAAGTTQSAGLSVKIYETYPDVVAGTCSAEYGTTTCAIGNLEANTSYIVAVRTGTNESGYTLTASTGLAEGSTRSPVVLALGVADPGQIDRSTSSYYSFTPDQSTYYVIDNGATNVDVFVRDPSGTTLSSSGEYGLDLGKTYSIEIRRDTYASVPDTTYTLTVTKNPYGDGTLTAPYALTAGTVRSSTLRNTNVAPHYGDSYYSFTTDQDGDAYGFYVRADRTFYLGMSAIPGVTCTGYGTMLQTCTVAGLSANTTFTFDVSASSGGDPRTVDILLLDLDGTEPCEPGNLSCETFASAPAYGNPGAGNTAWSWDPTALEYDASDMLSSCFTTTSPANSILMAFTVGITSTNTSSNDSIRVYLGASLSPAFTMYATSTTRTDRRRFLAVAGNEAVKVCFETYSAATRSASIDNLAFR